MERDVKEILLTEEQIRSRGYQDQRCYMENRL